MADASPAERDGHRETGAGHVRRARVCSRARGSDVLDLYQSSVYDQVSREVVPFYLTEDEEGRGVPLFLAAGELQLRGALQCLYT